MKESLKTLKEENEHELTAHLIPFWKTLRDERGGFYGLVDFDLNVHKDASKGCILNSRILYFFSRSYKILGGEDLRECADHAWRFLRDFCLDKENGGVFWSLNADGSPLDTTKHTYNQAFAIYALSNYFDATGNADALALAESLFDLIEKKCRDADGYLESFSRDFLPESNEKLSENGVMAERTMNTLLHVMEAYTDFFRVSKNPKAKGALEEILKIESEKIWNEKLSRQEVFFDKNYNSLIDLHSYGHDIESSWLVDCAAEILGDENSIKKITRAMAEKILSCAFKKNSVLNECERGIDDETRVWWVQAEAVVGFFNAWQKSGEEKFLDAACAVWNYIKNFFVDKREKSEWFGYLDENGTAKNLPIVEPWKCPYHNGRMCLEIISRISEIEESEK